MPVPEPVPVDLASQGYEVPLRGGIGGSRVQCAASGLRVEEWRRTEGCGWMSSRRK